MCHVKTSNSSASFKIGKGLRYNDSSGVLYVSIVSLDWGGGNSKGGKDCGIFKWGSTKDFLGSFCGGSVLIGGILHKIPIGIGGILEVVVGLDYFIEIFGGRFTCVGNMLVCAALGVILL